MIRSIRTVMGEDVPKGLLRLSLLAGLFLCGAVFASAQTPAGGDVKHFSPEQAVDLAIKNNLNLEIARNALDIKKRKSDLVWNQFLPSLGASGTLARDNWRGSPVTSVIGIPGTGTPATVKGISGEINPDIFATDPISVSQWHMLGSFSATLNFSFALVQGIRSFKEDYQAGLISFDKAKLQIEQNVRKMYNNILLLEANDALLQETYNNTQRQSDMAEANYKAGLAPRLTWLQAQVAVENLKPTINDLENSLSSLKGNFALLLGLPYDALFELDPLTAGISYIPQDVADLISKAASGKPDIKELQANIMTLQTQRKALALQSYTPFLSFGWNVSSTFIRDPFKDSWVNGDYWNKGGNFSVTLGMNFNGLFPFTTEGQQRKDMDANIQIQSITLAQMVRDTELEIFTTVNSLEKIRTTAQAQQAAVDLAQQSYNLTEEAYRGGLQDLLSVQNAALALEQAKLQLLTQQFNYLNGLIDLEYSTGVPFGTLSSAGTVSSAGSPDNNGGTK